MACADTVCNSVTLHESDDVQQLGWLAPTLLVTVLR